MRPKKSLGQNFLTSGKAVFEIIKAGDLKKGELVLEIGPGKGALTEKLLESGVKLIAIEKDIELIKILEEKFKENIENKSLVLINEDILNVDIDEHLKRKLKKFGLKSYKLIANIPYYITGAIIEKFLSCDTKPEKLVLLIQKEVAERIVAKDKKESILSLAVKLYGSPKIVYRVSAGSFFPKPKVDSAIISIEVDKNNLDKSTQDLYFLIIKKAFAYKRKIMLNNLKKEIPTLDGKTIDWENIFKINNLDQKIRAEDINKEKFLNLVKTIR